MFEYLMPLLVMPTFEGTLLDQTYHSAVGGKLHTALVGRFLGACRSRVNATDAELELPYRAFGVPGLGFKRGLADDLVVAPYASAMALMVAPQAACANLRRLAELGVEGHYGNYEALDYTPARLGRAALRDCAIVHAHYQGMSFLSFAYALLNRPMQRRFESYPPFQATELLLHERIPKAASVYPRSAEVTEAPRPEVGATP